MDKGFFSRVKDSLLQREEADSLSEEELLQLVDQQQNDKIDLNKFVIARYYCFYISIYNFLFQSLQLWKLFKDDVPESIEAV